MNLDRYDVVLYECPQLRVRWMIDRRYKDMSKVELKKCSNMISYRPLLGSMWHLLTIHPNKVRCIGNACVVHVYPELCA